MIPNGVEKYIVKLPTLGEILLSVIEDVICADGSDHFDIPRTRYTGHICAERLGDLHSECAYASGRTVDQDLLPGLNLSISAKTLQCAECRDGRKSRMFETLRSPA
jgi:hypothetical protein